MMFMIFILVLIIIIILGIKCAVSIERKGFNNGICPKCGKQLKFFDMDSHGGRGYCCRNCDYYTWVSYNCVDKNYNINKN